MEDLSNIKEVLANAPDPPDKATRRKMVKQWRKYAATQPYAGTQFENLIAEAVMLGYLIIDMQTKRYVKTKTGLTAPMLAKLTTKH